jgi:large subunit ribosomal protein L21
MMFAIIRTGGKQYKVSIDEKIVVEKIDSEVGSQVTFSDVLMIGTDAGIKVGSPLLEGASVVATLEKQTRDAKIIVFKKKRRHNYRRKRGHKQHKTILKIVDILSDGKAVKVAAPKVEKKVAAPKAVAPKAVTPKEVTPVKSAAPKTATAKAPAAKKAPAKKTKE